jgi:hypothetical protein
MWKKWIYRGTQDRQVKYQSNGRCGQCAVSWALGGTCKRDEMRRDKRTHEKNLG